MAYFLSADYPRSAQPKPKVGRISITRQTFGMSNLQQLHEKIFAEKQHFQ